MTSISKGAYLPREDRYIVVGDVHGAIDELYQLLLQNGIKIDATSGLIDSSSLYTIILLGDFIDRGEPAKIQETIHFLYRNLLHLNQTKERLFLIMGNHEDRVYHYITQEPTAPLSLHLKEEQLKYYETSLLLAKDPVLKREFLMLYRHAYTWLKYAYSEEFSITMTHAPCPQAYLAQSGAEAHQRMIKCASRSQNPHYSLDELLPYLIEEAEDNGHYHLFGHLSQPNIRRYKNKICIDTSAIYGNRLSALILEGERFRFDAVPFLERQKAVTLRYNLLFDFGH